MKVAFPEGRIRTSKPSSELPSSSSVVEEIRKYKELFDEGILSKDEFEEKKKQILKI